MPAPRILPQLTLRLPAAALPGFASLLQHGLLFPVDRPVGILPFLLALPGFNAEYIERTVQTIFLDGVAADRLDHELTAGSTLALSAAMPGLAGAIFRRQGLHASLRSQPATVPAAGHITTGHITLKLFNRIATDRVGDLLAHGFLVTGKALHAFAARREALFQPPVDFALDNRPLDFPALLTALTACQVVTVQGSCSPESEMRLHEETGARKEIASGGN